MTLVASGKACSALERDHGQYMARPVLGETKLKLDLPLLKHKPKEKQVEISHNTMYNCFMSLTTLPCREEVFLYFFKCITVRAWCSCSWGTAIVLALVQCWVVMFSLLPACPLCGLSSTGSAGDCPPPSSLQSCTAKPSCPLLFGSSVYPLQDITSCSPP